MKDKRNVLRPILFMFWLCILLPAFLSDVMAGQTDEGVVYELSGSHIVITGYKGTSKSLVIPALIDGVMVTEIGKDAFANNEQIESVQIPDSVTSVALSAFSGCKKLKAFTVASGNTAYSTADGNLLSKDGKQFLLYAPGREGESYTIPGSVREVCSHSFNNCSYLLELIIPDTVTKLSSEMIYQNKRITDLTIGSKVATIPTNLITEESRMHRIIVKNGVKTVESKAFYGCGNLYVLKLPDSIESCGSQIMYFPNGYSGPMCFCNDKVKTANASDGLHFIPNEEWDKLEAVYDFTVVGQGWFTFGIPIRLDRYKGTEKDVTIKKEYRCIIDGYYGDPNKPALYSHPDGWVQAAVIMKVTQLDWEHVFQGNTTLESVDWNMNLRYRIGYENCIDKNAFKGCKNLKSYPATATYFYNKIPESAFEGCSSLQEFTITNNIEEIGENAFLGCVQIKSFAIPDSVKTIGEHALGYYYEDGEYKKIPGFTIACSEYSEARAYAEANGIPVTAAFTEYELQDLGNDEWEITQYRGGANELSVPAKYGSRQITSVGENAFFENNRLKSITIADGIRAIEDHAFGYCENLQSITIPKSVEKISFTAFVGTPAIRNISVDPQNPKYSSSEGGLYDKTRKELWYQYDKIATQFILPAGVTTIHDCAAQDYNNLLGLSLPDGLRTIGEYAFFNCVNLKSVTIPESVTSIGQWAFGYQIDDIYVTKVPGFKIRGYAGSAAEKYASDNMIEFEKLEVKTPEPPSPGPGEDPKQSGSSEETLVFSFLPAAAKKDASYRLVLTDGEGKEHVFDLKQTPMVIDGTSVFSVTAYYDYTIKSAEVRRKNGSNWEAELKLTAELLKASAGKVVTSDGSIYGESKKGQKQNNPIRVSTKKKTVKRSKLMKKMQKVKALTVENAVGSLHFSIEKKGTNKTLYKKLSISQKGVLTLKKWKKPKKGTYKVKVKISADGNGTYQSAAVTKIVKIVIK